MTNEENKTKKPTTFDLLVQPKENISIKSKTIYLYDLNTDGIKKFRDLLKKNEDQETRFRNILPEIASLVQIKYIKEKKEPLPIDFIDQLTQPELEQIAQKYITIPSISILSKKKEDIDEIITQKENEPIIHYLDRLLIEKDKRTHSATDNLRKLFENSNLLGASIDKYKNSVAMSYLSASREIDKANTILSNHEKISEELRQNQLKESEKAFNSFNSHLRSIENKKREREEELNLFRLMSEMTGQSASLLKELSSAAATFLLEFDKRSKKTDSDTQIQINIALTALRATVILSALSLCFAVLTYCQNIEINTKETQWQNRLQESLELQRAEAASNLKLQQEIADMRIKLDEKPIIKPGKKPQ